MNVKAVSILVVRKLPAEFAQHTISPWFINTNADMELCSIWIKPPSRNWWIVVRPVATDIEETLFFNEHAILVCQYFLEDTNVTAEKWIKGWRDLQWKNFAASTGGGYDISILMAHALYYCDDNKVRADTRAAITSQHFFVDGDCEAERYIVVQTKRLQDINHVAVLAERYDKFSIKRFGANWRSMITRQTGTFLMAFPAELKDSNGVDLPPIGYIAALHQEDTARIISIVVEREFRRTGIGTKLVQRFARLFRNYKNVAVFVREENLDAQLFFGHLHCKGNYERCSNNTTTGWLEFILDTPLLSQLSLVP